MSQEKNDYDDIPKPLGIDPPPNTPSVIPPTSMIDYFAQSPFMQNICREYELKQAEIRRNKRRATQQAQVCSVSGEEGTGERDVRSRLCVMMRSASFLIMHCHPDLPAPHLSPCVPIPTRVLVGAAATQEQAQTETSAVAEDSRTDHGRG
jgi:ribosomal protein L32